MTKKGVKPMTRDELAAAEKRASELLDDYSDRGECPRSLQAFSREVGIPTSSFSGAPRYQRLSDRVRTMIKALGGRHPRQSKPEEAEAIARAKQLLSSYQERGECPKSLKSFAKEAGIPSSSFSGLQQYRAISDQVRSLIAARGGSVGTRKERLEVAIAKVESGESDARTLSKVCGLAGLPNGALYDPCLAFLKERAVKAIAANKREKARPKTNEEKAAEWESARKHNEAALAKFAANYANLKRERGLRRINEMRGK